MSKEPEWPVSVIGDDPRPTQLVLYRTPERWRFAIYMDGVMDGWLDLDPSDAPEAAQAALVQKLELGIGRLIRADWAVADEPGWWTAEVTLLD